MLKFIKYKKWIRLIINIKLKKFLINNLQLVDKTILNKKTLFLLLFKVNLL